MQQANEYNKDTTVRWTNILKTLKFNTKIPRIEVSNKKLITSADHITSGPKFTFTQLGSITRIKEKNLQPWNSYHL